VRHIGEKLRLVSTRQRQLASFLLDLLLGPLDLGIASFDLRLLLLLILGLFFELFIGSLQLLGLCLQLGFGLLE